MKCRFYKIITSIVLVVISITLILMLNASSDDRTWQVVFHGLPTKIVTDDAGLNVSRYVLFQTHNTLFYKDRFGNSRSRILSNWHRSLNNKRFQLCPNSSFHFDAENAFDLKFLIKYLKQHMPTLDRRATVFSADNGLCAIVELSKAIPEFLDYFSLMKNAPSIQSQKIKNSEIGLGPYYIDSIDSKKIVLLARSSEFFFEKVELLHQDHLSETTKSLDEIEDFNYISASTVPKFVFNRFSPVRLAQLKLRFLILNHKNRKVRKFLFNCLNVNSLRKAYFPGFSNFLDVSTLLPVGVPGGVGGRIKQDCTSLQVPNQILSQPIVFENWNKSNSQQFSEFIKTFNEQHNAQIKVTTGLNIYEKFYEHPHPYNLLVVSDNFDKKLNWPLAFAKRMPIGSTPGAVDFKNSTYTRLISELSETSNPIKQKVIGQKINALFLKEYIFLPLFQEEKIFYYPDNLSGLEIGDSLINYPYVGEIKR